MHCRPNWSRTWREKPGATMCDGRIKVLEVVKHWKSRSRALGEQVREERPTVVDSGNSGRAAVRPGNKNMPELKRLHF
ncbi:hypothetical protein T08_9570 [Trichinella sp. T8]|nr:hypothetical protein T08_9570 [Trichinella sp. T8]